MRAVIGSEAGCKSHAIARPAGRRATHQAHAETSADRTASGRWLADLHHDRAEVRAAERRLHTRPTMSVATPKRNARSITAGCARGEERRRHCAGDEERQPDPERREDVGAGHESVARTQTGAARFIRRGIVPLLRRTHGPPACSPPIWPAVSRGHRQRRGRTLPMVSASRGSVEARPGAAGEASGRLAQPPVHRDRPGRRVPIRRGRRHLGGQLAISAAASSANAMRMRNEAPREPSSRSVTATSPP